MMGKNAQLRRTRRDLARTEEQIERASPGHNRNILVTRAHVLQGSIKDGLAERRETRRRKQDAVPA